MHPVARSPVIGSVKPGILPVDLELEENEDYIPAATYGDQNPSTSKSLGKLPEVKLEPDLGSPALLAVLTNLQTQLATLIEENQRQRIRIQELESRPAQYLSPSPATMERSVSQATSSVFTPTTPATNSRTPALSPTPDPQSLYQPVHVREPKIPSPGEFHGKVSEYRNFIAQCSVTFVMCPHTYNTDERKVLFIVSLLRGPAMTWAREITEDEAHPLRNNYPAFKLALDNLYLDRNYKALCEDKLCELRQEKSVAHYATEFKSLVSPLGFNDPAKRCMFYRGLSSTVKTGLVTMGRASGFEALVNQAIALDQRQYQARREEKKSSNSAKPHPQQQGGKPPPSHPQQPRPQINVTPIAGPHTSYHRPPISNTEKERRRVNNLCRYCGEPKHQAENCPNRKTHSATSIAPYIPPNIPEKGQSQGPQR
jgi:Retrotransposon gag protein